MWERVSPCRGLSRTAPQPIAKQPGIHPPGATPGRPAQAGPVPPDQIVMAQPQLRWGALRPLPRPAAGVARAQLAL